MDQTQGRKVVYGRHISLYMRIPTICVRFSSRVVTLNCVKGEIRIRYVYIECNAHTFFKYGKYRQNISDVYVLFFGQNVIWDYINICNFRWHLLKEFGEFIVYICRYTYIRVHWQQNVFICVLFYRKCFFTPFLLDGTTLIIIHLLLFHKVENGILFSHIWKL